MSSYLYYILDTPVINDYTFDKLCKRILVEWDDRFIHPHYNLLDKEAMEAGSAYQLAEDAYPWGIKVAAKQWLLKGAEG